MLPNDALPLIRVDPETYEVTADGELLTCAPAQLPPLAQRYFLLMSSLSLSVSNFSVRFAEKKKEKTCLRRTKFEVCHSCTRSAQL
jgi:hypothetical protein